MRFSPLQPHVLVTAHVSSEQLNGNEFTHTDPLSQKVRLLVCTCVPTYVLFVRSILIFYVQLCIFSSTLLYFLSHVTCSFLASLLSFFYFSSSPFLSIFLSSFPSSSLLVFFVPFLSFSCYR